MFWKNFLSLCVNNNVSPNAVAKELGFASGSVTKWKNGSVPHNTTLLKIAEYFGVTVEYLLGETDIKTPPQLPQGGYHGGTDIKEKPSEQTEDEELVAEFIELLNGLTDEQLKSVFDYIEFIKRKE
jgi:transcriptional regulator with XRE-family HTH domain